MDCRRGERALKKLALLKKCLPGILKLDVQNDPFFEKRGFCEYLWLARLSEQCWSHSLILEMKQLGSLASWNTEWVKSSFSLYWEME